VAGPAQLAVCSWPHPRGEVDAEGGVAGRDEVAQEVAGTAANLEDATADNVVERDALPVAPTAAGDQPADRIVGPGELVVQALVEPAEG